MIADCTRNPARYNRLLCPQLAGRLLLAESSHRAIHSYRFHRQIWDSDANL
jgi:hypothetical protein